MLEHLLQNGKTFDKNYTLINQLDAGGFSYIWLAKDKITANTVVLKIMRTDDRREYAKQFEASFANEYEMLSQCDHPHIVTLIAKKETVQFKYLVLEYIKGENLYKQIRKKNGNLSKIQIATVMKHIGAALAYMHSSSPAILHLDLKPENIIQNEQGQYILIDFGISQKLTSKSPAFGESTLHASPEQLKKQLLTTSCDIFSLGIILYEMCTGSWNGHLSPARLLGEKIGTIPPIDTTNTEYSFWLQTAIDRCWTINPALRPTAHELKLYGEYTIQHKQWPGSRETTVIPDTRPDTPRPTPWSGSGTIKDEKYVHSKRPPRKPLNIRLIAGFLLLICVFSVGWVYINGQNANAKRLLALSIDAENNGKVAAAFSLIVDAEKEAYLLSDVSNKKNQLEVKMQSLRKSYEDSISMFVDEKDFVTAKQVFTRFQRLQPFVSAEKLDQIGSDLDFDWLHYLGDNTNSLDEKEQLYWEALNLRDNSILRSKFNTVSEQLNTGKLDKAQRKLLKGVTTDSPDLINTAIKEGADKNTKRKETPLVYLAVSRNYVDSYKALCIHGVGCNNRKGYFYDRRSGQICGSIATLAAAQGKTDILQEMLDYCSDANPGIINERELNKQTGKTDGRTALGAAAYAGRTSTVRWLLRHGANINALQSPRNVSPLHEAIEKENSNMFDFLLANGADVNQKDGQDDTPVMKATYFHRNDYVEKLLAKGAVVSESNYDMASPDIRSMLREEGVGQFTTNKLSAFSETDNLARFANGQLTLSGNNVNPKFLNLTYPNLNVNENFTVESSMALSANPSSDLDYTWGGLGILNDRNVQYHFYYDSNKYLVIDKKNNGNRSIIFREKNNNLRAGENRLKIKVQDRKVYFYLNNQLVYSMSSGNQQFRGNKIGFVIKDNAELVINSFNISGQKK